MTRRFVIDRAAHNILMICAGITVLTLAGIFMMLVANGIKTFQTVPPGDFLLNMHWNPAAFTTPSFGIGGMLWSTFLVTFGAMVLAVPVGIGTAAFISELAPARLRAMVKPAVEMLAAIPSVVIGFLGIVLVAPAISQAFGLNNGLNALNGAILLAVMTLPTLITIAEDAIHSVPSHYKEASYALGANRWETLIKVTLPSCASGILAAVMLGLGRALGETMTVLMATGNAIAVPNSFFDPVRTITATVAIEMGEVPAQTPHFYSLFACALVLFAITLGVNLVAERILSKLRKSGR